VKTIYKVAQGHAFVGKRGMLKEGEEVTEKDFADAEAFAKAISKGLVAEGKADDKLAKLQEAAKAAQEIFDKANEAFEKISADNASAGKEYTLAHDALLDKEKGYKEIVAARKFFVDASAELEKAKKPEEKAAAQEKVNKTKAVLAEQQAAVPEVKSLADALATAKTSFEKTSAEKTEAAKKYDAAKEELDKAFAALAEAEKGK
jgi:hypothetical protein